MNRPIIRLYGLVALLFALLVAFTSRWTIFEASSLRENPENKRGVLEQERIARGAIVAADGTVLARSVRGPEGIYQRHYPTGELFAQPIGYDYTEPPLGSTGVERFRNKELNGQSGTNLQSVLDQLQGKEPQGEKVITTLDPSAQRAARDALGVHEGAVVALDPQTGAVTRDGLHAQLRPQRPALAREQAQAGTGNERELAEQVRTQPRHPVRLRARLDVQDRDRHGGDRQRRVHAGIDGQRAQRHHRLGRAAEQRQRRELRADHAHLRADALGQHRLRAGRRARRQAHDGRYMQRFGFDPKPPLDYPADEMSASGEHSANASSPPRARWSTSAAWASARTNSRSRRCRWRRSPRRSPTTAG